MKDILHSETVGGKKVQHVFYGYINVILPLWFIMLCFLFYVLSWLDLVMHAI